MYYKAWRQSEGVGNFMKQKVLKFMKLLCMNCSFPNGYYEPLFTKFSKEHMKQYEK